MDLISKFDDCNDVDERHTSVLLQGISVIDKKQKKYKYNNDNWNNV